MKAKGERRKAKGERRKAKGERRKAKGERRKAKGKRRKAKESCFWLRSESRPTLEAVDLHPLGGLCDVAIGTQCLEGRGERRAYLV